MKIENEKLGCSFEIPDTLTVRQQLAYWQAMPDREAVGSEYAQNWEAAKTLITDWKSQDIPDIALSLDEMTSTRQAQIVMWAGGAVIRRVLALDEVPKNS